MSVKRRIELLEALAAKRTPGPAFDWESFGPLGVQARTCIEGFLTREDPVDAHGHQQMLLGSIAFNHLQGIAPSSENANHARQLMEHPEHSAFGASQEKHPDALALFEMLREEGVL